MQQGVLNRSRLAGIALAGAAMVALPIASHAQSHATVIGRADLMPLNGSHARGQAELRLSADQRTLTVIIQASGLEPGGVHITSNTPIFHASLGTYAPSGAACGLGGHPRPSATREAKYSGGYDVEPDASNRRNQWNSIPPT